MLSIFWICVFIYCPLSLKPFTIPDCPKLAFSFQTILLVEA